MLNCSHRFQNFFRSKSLNIFTKSNGQCIQGGESSDVVAIPRRFVHEGDSVWVMDGDKLKIAKATIVWRDEDEVLIRGGVAAGDAIVTSKISTPVDGMKLRTESTTSEPEKRAEVSK